MQRADEVSLAYPRRREHTRSVVIHLHHREDAMRRRRALIATLSMPTRCRDQTFESRNFAHATQVQDEACSAQLSDKDRATPIGVNQRTRRIVD